jgi:hypothetical protein
MSVLDVEAGGMGIGPDIAAMKGAGIGVDMMVFGGGGL